MPLLSDVTAPPPLRSSGDTLGRLSAMMFLQYWPLGAWGVTVGTFIAANTGDQGEGIFSAGFVGYSTVAGAVGGMLAPVLIGYVSDRHLSAERLLALMHLGCAASVWGLRETRGQIPFFLCLLAYFHCFVPSATLTNKIALRHLANVEREYPLIRVFGTAGWITAGLFVGFAWPAATGASIEATRTPLAVGAIANLIMAAYALSLPHTPPEDAAATSRSQDRNRPIDLLRNRPLTVFLGVAFLACMPSMAYNNYANLFLNNRGFPRPAALMTLGQVSDVLCLIAAPWFTSRFGLRKLFFAGTLAWTIRYLLLAGGSYYGAAWPVYAAILIHGPCYVFVYVVAVMYIDRLADPAYRGSAQGLLALASTGFGHLLGGLSAGYAQTLFLTPRGVSPPPYQWWAFWLVPGAISLAAAILFLGALAPAADPRSNRSVEADAPRSKIPESAR
ncbi:MAG: MFS transporter [Planctomycetales bacterium]|nr:MFS transporter [Planctomycetales bacterium]